MHINDFSWWPRFSCAGPIGFHPGTGWRKNTGTLFRQSSRVGPEEYLPDECLRILARLPKRLLIAPDMHPAPHTTTEEGVELVGGNIVAGALGRYLPGIDVPSQRAARNCGRSLWQARRRRTCRPTNGSLPRI